MSQTPTQKAKKALSSIFKRGCYLGDLCRITDDAEISDEESFLLSQCFEVFLCLKTGSFTRAETEEHTEELPTCSRD